MSEAKNFTAAVTSSAEGGRPAGERASVSGGLRRAVSSRSSILEGLITFTVMPFLASSIASEREKETTAAFAAA